MDGGYRVLGLRQINTCSKVPLQVKFLDDDILHCLLESYLSTRMAIELKATSTRKVKSKTLFFGKSPDKITGDEELHRKVTNWNYTLGLVIDYAFAVFSRRDSLQILHVKRRSRVRGRLCSLTRYFLPR
jgi:hypothetical protein